MPLLFIRNIKILLIIEQGDLDMLCDYHIYTHRCGDAQGNYEEYIENALKVGLTEIGFSATAHSIFYPKKKEHAIVPYPMKS